MRILVTRILAVCDIAVLVLFQARSQSVHRIFHSKVEGRHLKYYSFQSNEISFHFANDVIIKTFLSILIYSHSVFSAQTPFKLKT